MLKGMLPLSFSILLAGCSVSEADYSGSYVGGDDAAVIQLQLVEGQNGKIDGSISVSTIDYQAGKLKQTTKAISGVRNGKRLSLIALHKEWGESDAPLSLEAKGNSLVLNVPANGQTLELSPMDQDGYRDKLTKLASALTANDVGLVADD